MELSSEAIIAIIGACLALPPAIKVIWLMTCRRWARCRFGNAPMEDRNEAIVSPTHSFNQHRDNPRIADHVSWTWEHHGTPLDLLDETFESRIGYQPRRLTYTGNLSPLFGEPDIREFWSADIHRRVHQIIHIRGRPDTRRILGGYTEKASAQGSCGLHGVVHHSSCGRNLRTKGVVHCILLCKPLSFQYFRVWKSVHRSGGST